MSTSSTHTTPIPAGPVLSMSETATYLRSSRTSLYRMIRRGDVKPIKLGGRTLFRRTDLDALIEQCAEA